MREEKKQVADKLQQGLELIHEEESQIKDRIRKLGYQEEANDRAKTRLYASEEEAKNATHKAALKEDAVIRRETEIERREEETAFLLNHAKTLDRESQDKRDELICREAVIVETERDVKKLVQATAQKRELFEVEIRDTLVKLRHREKNLEDLTKANQSFKANLDEVAKQQAEDHRRIKDGYDTLIKAKHEILNKNNG